MFTGFMTLPKSTQISTSHVTFVEYKDVLARAWCAILTNLVSLDGGALRTMVQ